MDQLLNWLAWGVTAVCSLAALYFSLRKEKREDAKKAMGQESQQFEQLLALAQERLVEIKRLQEQSALMQEQIDDLERKLAIERDMREHWQRISEDQERRFLQTLRETEQRHSRRVQEMSDLITAQAAELRSVKERLRALEGGNA